MKNKFKTLCFDIDGIICNTKSNNYNYSKPLKNNIKLINLLYEKGYLIKLYTARGMGRNKDNAKKAQKNFKTLTIQQLKKWKVNYHKLFFGKPSFDLFIDDKSVFFKRSWSKYLKRKLL